LWQIGYKSCAALATSMHFPLFFFLALADWLKMLLGIGNEHVLSPFPSLWLWQIGCNSFSALATSIFPLGSPSPGVPIENTFYVCM
jgi:hypothetical protein